MEAVAASAAACIALAGDEADRTVHARTVSARTVQSGADELRSADPLRCMADACLNGLAEVARLEARTAALKAKLAAGYARAAGALVSPEASPQDRAAQAMALVAEVGCVLTVSERTAGALLSDAVALTTALPLTLAALQAGTISWQHARIIVEETAGLEGAGAAGLEAHFLDPAAPNPARGCRAGDLVASRFRAKARAWRERHHPVSIEKRHARCAADRRIDFLPDRDGMAWLSAYLPADTAAGIWERTTAAARALQGPAETRDLGQLRADVAATWLLTGTRTRTGTQGGTAAGGPGACGGVPSPRAQVLITVPVLALLGATEEPAVLDGYGPIPPSMARRLAGESAGSFYRVLTDPRDGAPLEIGRTSYRLTKAQRRWLRLRDGKCPFPGCSNQSLDNEADHLLAWAEGGTTGISNLGQPCPKHHRLKHGSAWTPTGAGKDNPPGWTSPSGRHYPSEHQDWEPPLWPESWPEHVLTADAIADHHLPTDPGHQPDPALTGDPGPDPGPDSCPDPGDDLSLELPPDPFPDWHEITAACSTPVADTTDPWRPVPPDDPFPESFLLQCA